MAAAAVAGSYLRAMAASRAVARWYAAGVPWGTEAWRVRRWAAGSGTRHMSPVGREMWVSIGERVPMNV